MALRLLLLSGYGMCMWHGMACATGLGRLQGKACRDICRKGSGRALLPPCGQRLQHRLCCPSSFPWFAVLERTFPNLNGLDRETGSSKVKVQLQGYCTVSSQGEGTKCSEQKSFRSAKSGTWYFTKDKQNPFYG